MGFTSTIFNQKKCIDLAHKNLPEEKFAVILQIDIRNLLASHFVMDKEDYSAYSSEKEVLLNDGDIYQVFDI